MDTQISYKPNLECPRCKHNSNDYKVEKRGVHNSCYCRRCGTWIKHLSHDNKYRTEEKKRDAAAKTSGCCAYCGEMLGKSFPVEHIHAQVKGGGHEIENLFAVCKSCNSRKGKKTVEQYREYLRGKTGQRIVFFFEEVSDINSLF